MKRRNWLKRGVLRACLHFIDTPAIDLFSPSSLSLSLSLSHHFLFLLPFPFAEQPWVGAAWSALWHVSGRRGHAEGGGCAERDWLLHHQQPRASDEQIKKKTPLCCIHQLYCRSSACVVCWRFFPFVLWRYVHYTTCHFILRIDQKKKHNHDHELCSTVMQLV